MNCKYAAYGYVLSCGEMSLQSGTLCPMGRLDLQPATAWGEIAAAGVAGADASVVEPAGPVATGRLSIIDAAAGLADFTSVAAQRGHAAGLLLRVEALSATAAAAVNSLVVIDESNAAQLRAVVE